MSERINLAEAFYDDEAILAGVNAVLRMMMLRVSRPSDHAAAFRRAVLGEPEPSGLRELPAPDPKEPT